MNERIPIVACQCVMVNICTTIFIIHGASDEITIVTNNERDSKEQLITVGQDPNGRVLVHELFQVRTRNEG